ncbi:MULTISPECIES: hypothetical protein [Bacillaceae]|uniref:hypothetical protein n=1 Tax=Bacillales TaxID=1385 RepID=UPI0018840B80|nr:MULTISPECIES: hypothetical protein [Bacillaceae]MBF0705805.1 hypothetical protein [Pseudalkalibacillus hwajinpoensis]MDO6658753.1 hypothetical protein [Anaerobacillus sp. 1_MG-2023]
MLVKNNKLILIFTVILLAFSMTSLSFNKAYADEVYDGDLSLQEEQLIELLTAIENMPDHVIERGNHAIEDYLEKESDFDFNTNELSNGEIAIQPASIGGIASCVGAVGTAIVVNFTPAKILKVKSALKTVGGATKFVKALKPYYKMSREDNLSKTASIKQAVKLAAGDAGPDAKEALLDLFGVSTVIGACSGAFE